MFNRKVSKVLEFLTVCRLFIRMKMRNNIIEDLESESLTYATVGEFLSDLKEEFGGEDDETMKVVELKKME